MNSGEKYISLCIPWRSEDGGYKLYRVADYDEERNELFQIDFDREKEKNGPRKNFYLYTKEDHNLDEVLLKVWAPDWFNEDKYYVYPNSSNIGYIYEVVYLEDEIENKPFNAEYIKRKLHQGFKINNKINGNILLVIGKENENLLVLHCVKDKFKKIKELNGEQLYALDPKVEDLNHDILQLSLFRIAKEDIISTEYLSYHLFIKEILKENRFFYKKLNLPNNGEPFFVRNLSEIIPAYVGKYIRKQRALLGLSNNERKNIQKILTNFLEVESNLEDLIKLSGFSLEEIKGELQKGYRKISDLYNHNGEMDLLIEHYLLNDKELYEQCLDIVRNQWKASEDEITKQCEKEFKEKKQSCIDKLYSYNQDIEKLEKDIREKEINSQTLDNQKIEKQEEIRQAKQELDEIKSFLIEAEAKREEIELATKSSLEDFKNNIVEATKLLSVTEAVQKPIMINSPVKEDSERQDFYFETSSEKDANDYYEYEEIQNLEDLFESLKDNLNNIFNSPNDIASCILSTILMHKALIVDNMIGREIADSLSLLLNSRTAEYICIPQSDIDLQKLISIVKESQSRVIYLDGLLDTYNEVIAFALYRACKDKYLFFGVSQETLTSIPRNVFRYAYYVYTDQLELSSGTDYMLISACEIDDLQNNKQKQECKLFNKMYRKRIILNRTNKEWNALNSYFAFLTNKDAIVFFIDNCYLLLNDEKRNQFMEVLSGDQEIKEKMEETICYGN